jgi:hypothetical protein
MCCAYSEEVWSREREKETPAGCLSILAWLSSSAFF